MSEKTSDKKKQSILIESDSGAALAWFDMSVDFLVAMLRGIGGEFTQEANACIARIRALLLNDLPDAEKKEYLN